MNITYNSEDFEWNKLSTETKMKLEEINQGIKTIFERSYIYNYNDYGIQLNEFTSEEIREQMRQAYADAYLGNIHKIVAEAGMEPLQIEWSFDNPSENTITLSFIDPPQWFQNFYEEDMDFCVKLAKRFKQKNPVHVENDFTEIDLTDITNSKGVFNHCADDSKRASEKEAWSMAVMEKYKKFLEENDD